MLYEHVRTKTGKILVFEAIKESWQYMLTECSSPVITNHKIWYVIIITSLNYYLDVHMVACILWTVAFNDLRVKIK